jgi:hypothetical protein
MEWQLKPLNGPIRPGDQAVLSTLSRYTCVFALVVVSSAASAQSDSPPSAELAKKCREMTVKAYPPVPAGTKKGTAQAERDFFKKCIENRGQNQN